MTKPTQNSELTNSPAPGSKTEKTDSWPTTNAEFLAAIFGKVGNERPFILDFSGKPVDREGWGGTPFISGKTSTEAPSKNWYFTLATYISEDGNYRRVAARCAAVHGLMLDDLGTKAEPLSCLDGCPPSYVIQTSEGNYQAGYLFNEPQTDFKRVKALNQATIDANMCDPGAKSPTTRWGRLPFASNGKHTPAFPCQLVAWNPERRYTIEQIAHGLELTMAAAAGANIKAKRQKPTGEALIQAIDRGTTDDVHIQRAAENPVITALKKRGLYKRPLGSGRHDITCPWVHEHTGSEDNGTAYFEPSDLFPIGGFKCHHTHGEKLQMGAVLAELQVSVTEAKHKSTIKIVAGELHRIADTAEVELSATGRYYQRGGLIVSVVTTPETDATQIKPLSQNGLLRALAGVAIWTRCDAGSGRDVICDPPTRVVGMVSDAEQYEHLPALTGLARQPHLRHDGTLVTESGFDHASGLFGVFDASAFNVPVQPTRDQADAALGELLALLTEFEFSSPHDRSAAIAAMLTAAVRPSLATAPMFHTKAPVYSSGKSYLSSIIATFATPTSVSATSFPTTDEECQKQLLALLLESPGVVVFDNLTTDLIPFKTLCSALTEEHITGRILGVSKTATVGTRVLFLSSGNNVEPVRDMTRRCVVIGLDPKVEVPAARQFNASPLTTVRTKRTRYVSAALTIVRAWIVAGKPNTPCKPLNSFEQWTEWVRQPLLWLGQPDPVAKVFETMAHDPDREMLGRLLHAWQQAFGDAPTMIRTAVSKAEGTVGCIDTDGGGELREAMREAAEERGEINRRRLGKWISRHAGRIVDGMRFTKASGTTSAERWRIERLTEQSVMSVSSVSKSVVGKSVATRPQRGLSYAEASRGY